MLESLAHIMAPYSGILTALMLGSLALFLISLGLLPVIVANIPQNYFAREHRPRKKSGWILWVIRNLIGGLLLVSGVLMLVLPGQGILTLLAGLYVVDAEWKYRLERKLVSTPGILRTINWIRRRRNRPDLEI